MAEMVEDNCTVHVPFLRSDSTGYFALFEGHRSGWTASRSASIHLHQFLQKEIDASPGNLDMKKCMETAFRKMDEHLVPTAPDRGTSASICVIENHTDFCLLSFANVGETRAILSSSTKAIRLNRDHVCDDEEERMRLQKCPAYAKSDVRVRNLNRTSRALGDHLMKQWVISTPHCVEVLLTRGNDAILLLSRSVAAVIGDQEAADLANGDINHQ